jgi:2-succinyl-6-hydroxy-2,4-cyclohexadiene-1-carboxylate synthase
MNLRNVASLWFDVAGNSSNPPLILLHGFTGTHHTWDGVRRRLVNKHFLLMPNLPGHGKSTTFHATERMTLDMISDALLEMLDRMGIEKTAVLGYSLGGRIALNFASKHQNRLTYLILESASPGIRNRTERQERIKADAALARGIGRNGLDWFVRYWENTPLLATQKTLSPQVIKKIRRERLSNTTKGLMMSLRSAGIGRMHPLWDQLESIERPILLIVGEKDEKYLVIAKEMKKHFPHCSLSVVKGAGHATHLENFNKFSEIVERFLDGNLKGDLV